MGHQLHVVPRLAVHVPQQAWQPRPQHAVHDDWAARTHQPEGLDSLESFFLELGAALGVQQQQVRGRAKAAARLGEAAASRAEERAHRGRRACQLEDALGHGPPHWVDLHRHHSDVLDPQLLQLQGYPCCDVARAGAKLQHGAWPLLSQDAVKDGEGALCHDAEARPVRRVSSGAEGSHGTQCRVACVKPSGQTSTGGLHRFQEPQLLVVVVLPALQRRPQEPRVVETTNLFQKLLTSRAQALPQPLGDLVEEAGGMQPLQRAARLSVTPRLHQSHCSAVEASGLQHSHRGLLSQPPPKPAGPVGILPQLRVQEEHGEGPQWGKCGQCPGGDDVPGPPLARTCQLFEEGPTVFGPPQCAEAPDRHVEGLGVWQRQPRGQERLQDEVQEIVDLVVELGGVDVLP
mmetsp:Transcript_118002/g.359006  ORF Transcript_118002/g.359006 Transcript_118002/m.359006 type:complete len:403 (+) Transcript_118002:380-1588(+)